MKVKLIILSFVCSLFLLNSVSAQTKNVPLLQGNEAATQMKIYLSGLTVSQKAGIVVTDFETKMSVGTIVMNRVANGDDTQGVLKEVVFSMVGKAAAESEYVDNTQTANIDPMIIYDEFVKILKK